MPKGRFMHHDPYDGIAAVIGPLKNGRWHLEMHAHQGLAGFSQYAISRVSIV